MEHEDEMNQGVENLEAEVDWGRKTVETQG
jgi:hypothetical protein